MKWLRNRLGDALVIISALLVCLLVFIASQPGLALKLLLSERG